MTVPVELFLQACLDEVTAETYVPIITDWEALVRMRSRTSNGSKPRQLIEERMQDLRVEPLRMALYGLIDNAAVLVGDSQQSRLF